jgi:hypothetical protein
MRRGRPEYFVIAVSAAWQKIIEGGTFSGVFGFTPTNWRRFR